VVSFTPFGRIITINPAALKMLRLRGKPEEFIGTELASLLGKKPAFKDLLAAFYEYKRNMKTSLTSDLRMAFREDSEEKEVVANIVITPMWDENRNLYASLMIIEDVTEIIRSKRLEAWAEMARIIAHEIKNPLTPIQLAAQHLQVIIKDRAENLDEISDECLTTILQKVTELKQFSDDFWHYSELPKLNPEPFNIGKFIEDVVSPYAIAPPEGVKLKIEIPPKTPLVMMDKKLMKQTFINLIENSYHAMHDGGILTIKIDYGRESRKAGIVEISVADTGIGIRAEDLQHVFEPYYSTKEKGVGLGLAIARKTIEEHQGTITIESRHSEGTVVKVSLRVHEGKRNADS
jgi:nitrogen fixation/metabolism regulation signal transduction histidine kinase